MSVWKYKDPNTGEVKKVGYASALTQGMQMDLLWENASPSSAFAAQTISLDLSQYCFVFVVAEQGTAMVMVRDTDAGGNTADIIGQATTKYGTVRTRFIRKVTSNGVYFDDAYQNGSTKTNDDVVPLFIYGIKGVTT